MPEPADRIESLFAAAVALPPGEREAYLERECSGDPALSDRLLALLKAHDRAGHVIDRPVDVDPDQTAGYAPTSEQNNPAPSSPAGTSCSRRSARAAWGRSGRPSRLPPFAARSRSN